MSVVADAPEFSVPPAAEKLRRLAYRGDQVSEGFRSVAEETAVALSYGGSTHAVMMATPRDLEDFAVGFSLTERIIRKPSEIETLEVVPTAEGIDVQMWLATSSADAFVARHRYLAGATGCGLCGVDSLSEAMREPPEVTAELRLDSASIAGAMAALAPHQKLHTETGAVHAAGFWRPARGIVAVREDVGRHNALDKLVGALASLGETGNDGVLLLTSRVSVEMVQKAAMLGAGILVAVSAPTALAIRVAAAAGITLVAVARSDGFEVFTHPDRVVV
jgi:FdhD protein